MKIAPIYLKMEELNISELGSFLENTLNILSTQDIQILHEDAIILKSSLPHEILNKNDLMQKFSLLFEMMIAQVTSGTIPVEDQEKIEAFFSDKKIDWKAIKNSPDFKPIYEGMNQALNEKHVNTPNLARRDWLMIQQVLVFIETSAFKFAFQYIDKYGLWDVMQPFFEGIYELANEGKKLEREMESAATVVIPSFQASDKICFTDISTTLRLYYADHVTQGLRKMMQETDMEHGQLLDIIHHSLNSLSKAPQDFMYSPACLVMKEKYMNLMKSLMRDMLAFIKEKSLPRSSNYMARAMQEVLDLWEDALSDVPDHAHLVKIGNLEDLTVKEVKQYLRHQYANYLKDLVSTLFKDNPSLTSEQLQKIIKLIHREWMGYRYDVPQLKSVESKMAYEKYKRELIGVMETITKDGVSKLWDGGTGSEKYLIKEEMYVLLVEALNASTARLPAIPLPHIAHKDENSTLIVDDTYTIQLFKNGKPVRSTKQADGAKFMFQTDKVEYTNEDAIAFAESSIGGTWEFEDKEQIRGITYIKLKRKKDAESTNIETKYEEPRDLFNLSACMIDDKGKMVCFSSIGKIKETIKNTYYEQAIVAINKMRESYPQLSQKELDNLIENFFWEWTGRKTYSLHVFKSYQAKQANEDFGSVIKALMEEIFTKATTTSTFTKATITGKQKDEIRDAIFALFKDALIATSKSAIKPVPGKTADIVVNEASPPKLAGYKLHEPITSFREIKDILYNEYADRLRQLVEKMKGFGNVTNSLIKECFAYHVMLQKYPAMSIFKRQSPEIKHLSNIFGPEIDELIGMMIRDADEMRREFCDRTFENCPPKIESWSQVTQVINAIIHENVGIVESIFQAWMQNKDFIKEYDRLLVAFMGDFQETWRVSKQEGNPQSVLNDVLIAIFDSLSDIFGLQGKTLREEEFQILHGKYSKEFSKLFQNFVMADLASVSLASDKAELLKKLYVYAITHAKFPNKKKCPECGEEVPELAEYCPSCGAALR